MTEYFMGDFEMCPVSVIIPAYNEEKLLPRAIDSVLKQSCLPQEVIVVDDGSSDRTAEIAKSYGGTIRCYSKPNEGLAAARNTGISIALGEYIAFLDSDDEWLPDHLRNAFEVFQKHPDLKWYACGYERCEEDGEVSFVKTVPEYLLKDDLVEDYFHVQSQTHFSLPSMMIIKSEVFSEIGGFDLGIGKFGEDLDMWFRIALSYPTLGYSKYVGAKYWFRQGSITSQGISDLTRFLNRIRRTESHALYLGCTALLKTDPLVVDWLVKLMKESMRRGNKAILNEISKYYGGRLSVKDRVLLNVAKRLPAWLLVSAFCLKDRCRQ